jgi:hypothetical protein
VPSSDPIQRFNDIIENIERIERMTAGLDLKGFAAQEVSTPERRCIGESE